MCHSFGFGGANAHAILENYQAPTGPDACAENTHVFSPFIFSATNEFLLSRNLQKFRDFLHRKGTSINMQELAHTLHSKRSRLPVVASFSASTTQQLSSRIESWLESSQRDVSDTLGSLSNMTTGRSSPKVICIFTGQGAQWARMGVDLLESSEACHSILERLDARLSRLPEPPLWSLIEELKREATASRVSETEISQPLCTAVQILLVEIMRNARISIVAVVGHSSGEIAAAYAQKIISAEDAICIAYYRGFHTQLARTSGAMLAVGSSQVDVEELLQEPEFVGRACIAAINSSNSVTVSGQVDAIQEIQEVLRDEQKFVRLLKIDRAYHSHLMANCSDAYLRSMDLLNIPTPAALPATWSSSTYGGSFEGPVTSLAGPYWDLNLRNPVKFMQAVRHACELNGPFDLAIEIGPHPALKAPFLQNVHDFCGQGIPYTSLLRRGSSDLDALADGLGYIAAHLGKEAVDFQSFDTFMAGAPARSLRLSLPPYSWNHEYEYWFESRYCRAILQRSDSVHMLLGHLCPNSTDDHRSWRNILRPKELRWLEGHRIQCQMVFPAAGYITAAIEACLKTFENESVSLIQISDITFSRALTFDSTESEVEVVTYLTDIRRLGERNVKANFSFNAARSKSERLEALTHGSIQVWLGASSSESLPPRGERATNLMEVQSSEFYNALSQLGYRKFPFVKSFPGKKLFLIGLPAASNS
jgi:hybrid polyketide synthase/nonribosomal peptide synthetase ACE1